MISQGKFQEDLFYRLNVSQIHIPPLRERKEDIIPLANFFLAEITHPIWGNLELDEKTLMILARHFWPGNVRELEKHYPFYCKYYRAKNHYAGVSATDFPVRGGERTGDGSTTDGC